MQHNHKRQLSYQLWINRLILCCFLLSSTLFSAKGQDYGHFPSIPKELLVRDIELLQEALDQFHSGMYWYSSKDSVELAFQEAKAKINKDLNVMEFHKIVTPLVGLSREDHTDVFLPEDAKVIARKEAKYFPFTIVFLGTELYIVKNASNYEKMALEGQKIKRINGQSPKSLVEKISQLFASDGYIKTVKYSDLEGFTFAKYFYYYFGIVKQFELEIEGQKERINIEALSLDDIRTNLKNRYTKSSKTPTKALLEFNIINDSVAYLGIHDFSNTNIRQYSKEKSLKQFLKKSFESISQKGISTLIVDVSENTGGSEGNEGLLYSYFGENYQKYHKVRANKQKLVLDNGIDPVITLKTFGFFERLIVNKKMEDGSFERRANIGLGLEAYKKEPKHKFKGKTYVIIGPVTYSGGSEFSNMMYSQGLATFVGQETGGGYYGNTSGYGKELVLPHSKIVIDIPTLQFMMNVEPKLPKGSGVIPHHKVIPTFEQYSQGANAGLEYILNNLLTP